MNSLKLKDPRKKIWPDFFGKKTKERKEIEKSKAIKSLIDSKLLLSQELNSTLYTLNTKTLTIEEELSSEATIVPEKDTKTIETLTKQILSKKTAKQDKKITKRTIDSVIARVIKALLIIKEEEKRDMIINISEEMEDVLATFESKNNINLKNILFSQNLYYCKSCKALYSRVKFKVGKCKCNSKIKKVSDVKRISATLLTPEVRKFIDQNMWLEYGIEKIYKTLGFETQCGTNILGNSGVFHEIDLLAVSKKNNQKILGECKTTSIKLNDVLCLCQKMTDIGCSLGYIFTTSIDPVAKSVKKFIAFKNIRLVKGVLELSSQRLKKLLRTKV